MNHFQRLKEVKELKCDGCQHKCQRQGAPASEWAVEENDQDRWCAQEDTATCNIDVR